MILMIHHKIYKIIRHIITFIYAWPNLPSFFIDICKKYMQHTKHILYGMRNLSSDLVLLNHNQRRIVKGHMSFYKKVVERQKNRYYNNYAAYEVKKKNLIRKMRLGV